MKRASTIAIIAISVFCGGAAFAATLELVPAFEGEKIVKAHEFVTIAFVATSHADADETFTLSVSSHPLASLISTLNPVVLSPGAPKKIALTFAISLNVEDRQSLPVEVTLASTRRPDVTARAEVVMVADAKVCAAIDLPDAVSVTGKENKTVVFALQNCGSGRENFAVNIEPGKYIVLREAPEVSPLEAGESGKLKVTFFSIKNAADYASNARISVMRNGFPITEKTIKISVRKPPPKKRDKYFQFITLRLKLEHLLRTGLRPRTAIKLTIPLVQDNDLSFKSDVWMDPDNQKLEIRHRRHEMGFRNNTLVIGNQSVPFSEMIRSSGDYEGWLYARSFGEATMSMFRGSDGTMDIRLTKWEQTVTPRLAIGMGRMSTKVYGSGPSHLAANNFSVHYTANRHLTLNSEIANSKLTGGEGIPARSGLGFRIGGNYNRKSLQLSAVLRDSHKGFAANGFQRGIELRTDYELKQSRIFMNFERRLSYRVHRIHDDPSVQVPYNHENRSLGWTRMFEGPKLSLFASINSSSLGEFNTTDPLHPEKVRKNSLTFKLGRQFEAFYLGAGIETGREKSARDSRKFREHEFSGNYNRNNMTFRVSLVRIRTLDITTIESGTSTDRRLSANLGYTLPNRKVSAQIGWKKDFESSFSGESWITKRTIFRLNSRPSRRGFLRFEHETMRREGSRENTFTVSYFRNLEIKIPYKKQGSVSGAAFVDRNKNGIFDEPDKPVKNAIIRLGNRYRATTDSNGYFEIINVIPGKYNLEIDQTSYPVGLSQNDREPRVMRIKSDRRTEVNLAFHPLCRISGRVNMDKSNYFLRFSNIAPDGLRVVLSENGQAIDETFTNRDGDFYFEDVKPGMYEVMLDPEWLPRNAVIKGKKNT